MKVVTTIGGLKEPRTNVRYIKGEYYKIGDSKIKDSGECYYVDGMYCRAGTGFIEYDHEKQEYVKSSSDLTFGVVDVKEDSIIEGYFTPSIKNATLVMNGRNYTVINGNIFNNNRYFREKLSDGIFYNYKEYPSIRYSRVKPVSNDVKRRLPYDSRYIFKDFVNDYNENDIEISEEAVNLAECLKDLTFGVEFETIAGYVPDRISKPLGLMQLRDGSIDGLEFVTVPLHKSKGVQTLIEILSVLKERTKYDMSCSLHVHFGNVYRTKEFILALYKQLCYIQNPFYSMFPLYKKENLGVKRKHYTKPLPTMGVLDKIDSEINDTNINENFNILFNYFSGGLNFSKYKNDLENVKSHPSDPEGNSKWNIDSRYCVFNFIPLIFGNKETVEFRVHTPTYDWEKVRNYIALCANIINHVKENTDAILNGKKIHKRIEAFADDARLTRYIRDRISFSENCIKKGDINYNEDELKISKSFY